VNRRFAFLLVLCAATMHAQSDRPAATVIQFLHIVADLDQSVAFYHDQLGLQPRGPGGEYKFTDNPVIANLYGVPGRRFRAAVLKIPGATFGIELVQWGQAQQPKRTPVIGPGTVTLILHGGQRSQSLYDPDGFPVQMQPSGDPGADLGVSVKDPKKLAALYDRLLPWKPDSVRLLKAAGRSSRNLSFPTPGQGMIRLSVSNFDAVTESLKAAGCSVITTGGAPVTLPQGPRVIILRDANNFYWQLMEASQK
jgi:catechol 2,3-dioxygenase-like lactoylglutathione lyase family enzyme